MDNRSPIGRHCPLSGDDVLSAKGQEAVAKAKGQRPRGQKQGAKGQKLKAKGQRLKR